MHTEKSIEALISDREAILMKAAEMLKEIKAGSIELENKKMSDLGINIGDVVNVSKGGSVQRGIFQGFCFKYGKAEPVVKNIKKDGTASVFSIYSCSAVITKAGA